MMRYSSNETPMFRSKFSEDIFKQKYAHEDCTTWADLSKTLVNDVCGDLVTVGETHTVEKHLMSKDERDQLIRWQTLQVLQQLLLAQGGGRFSRGLG